MNFLRFTHLVFRSSPQPWLLTCIFLQVVLSCSFGGYEKANHIFLLLNPTLPRIFWLLSQSLGIFRGPLKQKKKRPSIAWSPLWRKKVAMTYSPTNLRSTIGADGLNFSVRNGKRWIPDAIDRLNIGLSQWRYRNKARYLLLYRQANHFYPCQHESWTTTAEQAWRYATELMTARIFRCGATKAFGQLVLLDWTHRCAYICSLSTSWSTTTLMRKSNLVVGFALRCFQRLSRPDADTQRCSWRNNWYTGGRSITVLSY